MTQELKIEFPDAKLLYKNFAGEEQLPYNSAGDRNFAVVIEDEELAYRLLEDGWNVKFPKPSPDIDPADDNRNPTLAIGVGGKNYDPKILLINANGSPTHLIGDELNVLDWSQIIHADLVVQGSVWDVQGKTGIKAYVKALYIKLEMDSFQEKYGF